MPRRCCENEYVPSLQIAVAPAGGPGAGAGAGAGGGGAAVVGGGGGAVVVVVVVVVVVTVVPAVVQSVAIAACASASVTVPAQTSECSVFSTVSLECEPLSPFFGSGQRLARAFEPPSSSGIKWSIVYFERSFFETLYSEYTFDLVLVDTLRTDFV